MMPTRHANRLCFSHTPQRGRNRKEPPRYKVSKEIIREIVRNKLEVGGKICMPTIEAPYGLYDSRGNKVVNPGPIAACNFSKKMLIIVKGAELAAPLILNEINQYRDVHKIIALRDYAEIWKEEEITTGNLGPFFSNEALTRNLLDEFSKKSESEQAEIRFYAKILQISRLFLDMSREDKIIHTEHFPAKLYVNGPDFPHPETVKKGEAFFLKEGQSLPFAIITEIGRFSFSKLAALNDPEKLREFKRKWNHSMQIVDVNSLVSYSSQYPFMGQGSVTVNASYSEAENNWRSHLMKWSKIRDFVYLLNKL